MHPRSCYLRRMRIAEHFMDGSLSLTDSLSFITAASGGNVINFTLPFSEISPINHHKPHLCKFCCGHMTNLYLIPTAWFAWLTSERPTKGRGGLPSCQTSSQRRPHWRLLINTPLGLITQHALKVRGILNEEERLCKHEHTAPFTSYFLSHFTFMVMCLHLKTAPDSLHSVLS